ncbi:MAG TPA: LysE family translocator [Xanthomonadales bacterium]|nr:LysE family translocator [Xanthomonadales bacterium]
MSWAVWFLFFVTETVLSFAPGPAVLYVVGTGLRRGFAPSFAATLGILSANTIYFAASALGLGLVIAKAQWLFTGLKWAGAAYLVWLAVAAFRARPEAHAPATNVASGRWQAYRGALLLQLANPKAILFFTALLPQFVHPEAAWSVPFQILVLGVTSVASEVLVLAGYGALAARAAKLSSDPKLLRWFERASGACLLGCAALVLAA